MGQKASILDNSDSRLDFRIESPRIGPYCLPYRRCKFLISFTLSAFLLVSASYVYFFRPRPLLLDVSQNPVPQLPAVSSSTWNRMSALLGPPTDRFRGSPASRYHCFSVATSHMLS